MAWAEDRIGQRWEPTRTPTQGSRPKTEDQRPKTEGRAAVSIVVTLLFRRCAMKRSIRLAAVLWAVMGLLGSTQVAYGEAGSIIGWGEQVVVPQEELTNLTAVATGIATSASPRRNHALAQEPPPVATRAPTKHMSPVDLFSTLAPAVVKLIVEGEGRGVVGSGSGFVVAAPSSTICHVVTNYHVIRAAVTVKVEFHDGSVAGVRDVLSEDPALDLAILRVDLVKQRDPLDPHAQPTIDIQKRDRPSIGTRLYAIGSPKGMKNTLSDGLLSGYRFQDSEVTWVQITNPISPGSSGGPVFTDTGAFVGVTTASLPDAQNLNFAIAAKKVQEFVARRESPRPLWKGSCIDCEEREFLLRFYSEVFERFRRRDGDPELRSPSDQSDLLMWTLGLVYNSRSERFLEYCTTEAQAGNQSALIVLGYFQLGGAGSTSPERIAQMNEAATLLKQAIPLAGDDTFFILLEIGKAQVSLLGELETSGTLQEGSRERFLDDALRTLEAARDLSPRFAPTLFHLGETLMFRGRPGEALQVSGQLVLLVPNSSRAHAQRAEILRLLGSNLAAIEELRITCGLDPYNVFYAKHLGHLYAETGQHEKAIEAYRRGMEANDEELRSFQRMEEAAGLPGLLLDAHGWRLHCSIARAFVALKRYEEGIDAYRRALDAAGDGAGAKNRLMLERELAACRAALAHRR